MVTAAALRQRVAVGLGRRLRTAPATSLGASHAAVGRTLLVELRAALAGGVTPAAALIAAVDASGAASGAAAGAASRIAAGAASGAASGVAAGAASRIAASAASPVAAGAAGPDVPPELVRAARNLRLGGTLEATARALGAGSPAGLLVASLALSERTGSSALTAVDAAAEVIADRRRLEDLLHVRSTQARGTAAVLTAVPAAAWAVLLIADLSALRFYTTAAGALSGLLAVLLALVGWRWARRILERAQQASAEADPLAPAAAPADPLRGLVVGVPVVVAALVLGGLLAAVVAGGVAWALGSRRRPRPLPAPAQAGGHELGTEAWGAGGAARGGGAAGGARGADVVRAGADRTGGAASTADLLAAALEGGLGPLPAIRAVEPLAPHAARPILDHAARRLAVGADLADAFAATPLAQVGAVLAAGARWGAPSAPALRRLAADWRAAQRTAAEAAAERAELALVFPTTLLTLPAFALAVVPPLLWTAVAR